MRWLRLISGSLAVVIVGGAVADGAVGHTRSTAFMTHASALESTWSRDIAEGVPASSLMPMRQELAQSREYRATWWTPAWFTDDGTSLLGDLSRRTDAAWTTEMASARNNAGTLIADGHRLTGADGALIPATTAADMAGWPTRLAAATTPASVVALTTLWNADLASAQDAVAKAKLAAAINGEGGAAGLVAASDTAMATAGTDDLDPGDVPALSVAVEQEITGGVDTTATSQQLVVALKQLQSLISLNDQVTEQIGPLGYSVAQDAAEQNPGAADALSALAALRAAFRAARTPGQMTAVAGQMTALQTQMTTTLAADTCGHAVAAGKVITINLTLQEGVFYQDGCVVQAAPVTTGRPALRTPPGDYHVFFKTTPWVMRSPWPKPSPFWYPDSPVSWVLEFLGGGYFLHDAPWEAPAQYGAGSENTGAASHGCIHIPTTVMRWLYNWTPVGTPVIVSA